MLSSTLCRARANNFSLTSSENYKRGLGGLFLLFNVPNVFPKTFPLAPCFVILYRLALVPPSMYTNCKGGGSQRDVSMLGECRMFQKYWSRANQMAPSRGKNKKQKKKKKKTLGAPIANNFA